MEKQYKLPKIYLENWINALESERYNQGQYILFNSSNSCYCANGVGYAVNGAPIERLTDVGCLYFSSIVDLKLPRQVSSYNKREKRIVDGLFWAVAKLNDNGKTFKEIAQWLKENVEGY